jgi:uncharacterized protein YdeI (YjbR/CyaY-like superfamily)
MRGEKWECYKNIDAWWMPDLSAWHKWLSENHAVEKRVWLIIYHTESATRSVTYQQALDECNTPHF